MLQYALVIQLIRNRSLQHIELIPIMVCQPNLKMAKNIWEMGNIKLYVFYDNIFYNRNCLVCNVDVYLFTKTRPRPKKPRQGTRKRINTKLTGGGKVISGTPEE